MNPEYAVALLKSMMFQAITLATPCLVTAMIIGIGISMFQAVTTIHEQTLTFVPKALGVLAVLIVILPWMLRTLIEFTIAMIQKMPDMVQ